MRSLTTMILTISALVIPAFGQVNPAPTKKTGMVWHYFQEAQKCDTELNATTAERDKAFTNLAEKVKEGDKNKVQLYMRRVNDSQMKVSSALGCSNGYSVKLEESAGRALLSKPDDISLSGYMTEEEYDKAMTIVKDLKKKIGAGLATKDQRKIWDEAVKVSGVNPEYWKLSEWVSN